MVLSLLDPVSIQGLYKKKPSGLRPIKTYLIGFWKLSFKSGKDQQYDTASSRGKMRCLVAEISATSLCEAMAVFFPLPD